MSSQQKYLNTVEVSKKFNCTVGNVQKLIRESKLTPINPYHKTGYLFCKEYIESIAKKRKEVQNG